MRSGRRELERCLATGVWCAHPMSDCVVLSVARVILRYTFNFAFGSYSFISL